MAIRHSLGGPSGNFRIGIRLAPSGASLSLVVLVTYSQPVWGVGWEVEFRISHLARWTSSCLVTWSWGSILRRVGFVGFSFGLDYYFF